MERYSKLSQNTPEGVERFASGAEAYAPRRIWSRRQTQTVRARGWFGRVAMAMGMAMAMATGKCFEKGGPNCSGIALREQMALNEMWNSESESESEPESESR